MIAISICIYNIEMHLNASRTIEENPMIEKTLKVSWIANEWQINSIAMKYKIWLIVIAMDWKYVHYWLNDLLSEP